MNKEQGTMTKKESAPLPANVFEGGREQRTW